MFSSMFCIQTASGTCRMSGTIAEGRLQTLQVYRLLQCIHQADKDHIDKMLKFGVKDLINLMEPRDGVGALHMAVRAYSDDLVSFLLSRGAHPDIQDKRGRTPVMLAAELGSVATVTLLVQHKADLSLQDAEGKGVLFYCMYPTKRHARCLQMAVECQADINNVSAEGTHIFQLMCEKAQEFESMCLAMLQRGADPNAKNQRTGVTALMAAVKAGCLQLARAILKKGGNVNALDHQRLSAVHYAAMGGFLEVIQLLSANSAQMDVISLDENTPLHYAAATGDALCCKFLVQRGCNHKMKNQKGLLPHQIAKEAGHKVVAKQLKKAQKPPEEETESSEAILMSEPWALTLHDWSNERERDLWHAFGDESDTVSTEVFISVLQELKVPIEEDQLLQVISAHEENNEGLVNIKDFITGVKYIQKPFLLSSYVPKKKKAAKTGKKGKKGGKSTIPMPIGTLPQDIMQRRQDGGPPQFMIESCSNLTDVCRLDSKHPVKNDTRWYTEKPQKVFVNINTCVKSGDLESLGLAFSQGVPVDVQDEYYKTPLMVACSSGNDKVVQYLLKKGANVTMSDQFRWTPLHHAAHGGHTDIAKLLLEAGADVNACTLNGGTPLMKAIECSRISCVDLLLNAGADVTSVNKAGKNCLDIARDFADSAVIDLITCLMDSPTKQKQKKTGCVKLLSTSQLMSQVEKQMDLLPFDVESDDFMSSFSQNIQKKFLEQAKNTG
ncbi:ankyrin repeat and EF-hand domain-containing protein 1a [Thalassophryne amazonica]|uniref:ankyrin repeat and EF-hand domain-containing protein 1a n=1 Tax=Thalassophryne amazonica TaxID=390379 RepID=UPI00147254AB|nr:ankyrin repeat and EF-hand domain-containing protein 1a [Thalassophryne amazonica]